MIEFKEFFFGGIHEHRMFIKKNNFLGGIHENCMFMKKHKLACKTIFLNIVNFYCII